MRENDSEIKKLKHEVEVQKGIAYTAGLLQGDVTIRTLFESLAEGVVVVNKAARIVMVNRRTEELFGYDRKELQGESLAIFIPEQYRNTHEKHLKSYFSDPKIRPMGTGFELSGMRKNGNEIPIEVSLSYLEVETGMLGLAFITDISKRKDVEKELLKKNKQLDEFAQVVAHDLKDNISSLVGMSEILIDPTDSLSREDQIQLLKEIASSGRKMSDIIGELLFLARINKKDLNVEELNMEPIIHSAMLRLNDTIKSTSANITINKLDGKALGYAPWIEEVWLNYISNAIKYGEMPPKIEIGNKITNGEAFFWVKNYGEGLTDKQINLVFNDDHDARELIVKGHGIGLTIVKNIIEKLNGTVGVSSKKGEHTTFHFSLPLAK